MGWFLPILFAGVAATGVWGWAAAENARAEQAKAGTTPMDPFSSIFGGLFGTGTGGEGGLGLGTFLPMIMMFMMMRSGGSSSDDSDVNITVVEDDD